MKRLKNWKLRSVIIGCVVLVAGFGLHNAVETEKNEAAKAEEAQRQDDIVKSIHVTQLQATIEYGEPMLIKELVETTPHGEVGVSFEHDGHVMTKDDTITPITLDDVILNVTIEYIGMNYLDDETVASTDEIYAEAVNHTITISVVDTVKPEFSGEMQYSIEVGETLDLASLITANDKIDGALDVSFDGTVDYNKAGEYHVIAKAVDKNSNETTRDITISIKDKPVVQTAQLNRANTHSSSKNTSSNGSTSQSSSSENQPNAETTSYGDYFIDTKSMLGKINNERSKVGVKNLVWSSKLEGYAKTRAKELCDYYGHTRPNGQPVSSIDTSLLLGENIAAGFRSEDAVFVGWMDSEGHKANILHAEYDSVGAAGYYCGNKNPNEEYSYYWVQIFNLPRN